MNIVQQNEHMGNDCITSIIQEITLGLKWIFAPFGYSLAILVFEWILASKYSFNVCTEIEHVKL